MQERNRSESISRQSLGNRTRTLKITIEKGYYSLWDLEAIQKFMEDNGYDKYVIEVKGLDNE